MDELREIQELRAELLKHSRSYYDLDAPTISDFEYDALMRRLKELEKKHPETVTPEAAGAAALAGAGAAAGAG